MEPDWGRAADPGVGVATTDPGVGEGGADGGDGKDGGRWREGQRPRERCRRRAGPQGRGRRRRWDRSEWRRIGSEVEGERANHFFFRRDGRRWQFSRKYGVSMWYFHKMRVEKLSNCTTRSCMLKNKLSRNFAFFSASGFLDLEAVQKLSRS